MSARPAHANKWTRIAATIDNARKPEPPKKVWPAWAVRELQRHMAGMPETDLYYVAEDLFR